MGRGTGKIVCVRIVSSNFCLHFASNAPNIASQQPVSKSTMFSPSRLITEKDRRFPLDTTMDISLISDHELTRLFCTGPVLYEFGSSKVVRLSEDLVIKGGACMTRGEVETQKMAANLGFRVPAVRRVFQATLRDTQYPDETCWLMVVDFVRGQVLEQLWPTMGQEARKDVAKQVSWLIRQLQSAPVKDTQPGPVGGSDGEP